jgi:hypothetical protein
VRHKRQPTGDQLGATRRRSAEFIRTHIECDGEHFFVLTANGDGTTRLNHGERFSGALVALARGSTKNGAAGYEAFSLALKQRVEQLRQAR